MTAASITTWILEKCEGANRKQKDNKSELCQLYAPTCGCSGKYSMYYGKTTRHMTLPRLLTIIKKRCLVLCGQVIQHKRRCKGAALGTREGHRPTTRTPHGGEDGYLIKSPADWTNNNFVISRFYSSLFPWYRTTLDKTNLWYEFWGFLTVMRNLHKCRGKKNVRGEQWLYIFSFQLVQNHLRHPACAALLSLLRWISALLESRGNYFQHNSQAAATMINIRYKWSSDDNDGAHKQRSKEGPIAS